MTPEHCLATARELALQIDKDAAAGLVAEWRHEWPSPEAVAWTLAHMLAQTLPAASTGFARRSPRGEGASPSP